MEKRKFQRVNSTFEVWYQTLDMEDLSFGKPITKNISGGGLLLILPEIEKVGMAIRLKFRLPLYDEVINIEGKVVRVKRLDVGLYDMGIEFTQIKSKDRDLITAFAMENN
ncbi:MAG: PilZ domain-containing protein [Spirochaetes bacterium]|nr:PilZ domain-containing protein [Spirochaetota bacterium]